jgi:cytochrome P450 family 710 subfamily A protein
MNASTSQAAFLGPYIEDAEHFQGLLKTMNGAFASLPISFPGNAIWKTKHARVEVENILTKVVTSSKKNMQADKPPSCLLDFWSQSVLNEMKKFEERGECPPDHTSDFIMAITVMDFLSAAQDASTSSLAQTVALMSDCPDILEKVQGEQHRVNASKAPISFETLKEMTYTRQVIKEVLRFRPPVPMWAHTAMSNMEIENGYHAPKGCVVFSSISAACREGFTNPDKFDPDRMGLERKEDVKYCTNFLVFGAGPHMCAGREYAMNHMVVFLSVLSTSCTWTRRKTSKSDEIVYMPSAYPADLLITFHDN